MIVVILGPFLWDSSMFEGLAYPTSDRWHPLVLFTGCELESYNNLIGCGRCPLQTCLSLALGLQGYIWVMILG